MIKIGKNTREKQKGITLLALVITIVVLLIIAGISISMLTGENGTIGQAIKAKKETEKNTNRESIKLAIIQSNSDVNDEIDESRLEKNLKELLGEETELKSDKRGGYIVEKKGKTLGVIDENGKLGEGIWHYSPEEGEDLIITDGENKLEIGDEINYDCTKDEKGNEITESYTARAGYGDTIFNAKDYTGKWGVLGAENGKILIMPLKGVAGYLYICGGYGYENGLNELNKISEIYGHGKGAVGARSLKVEDVNKVTGYNPNNVGVRDLSQKGTGTKYGEGELLREYGKEIICEKKDGILYYNGLKSSDWRFGFYDEEGIWRSLGNGKRTSFVTTKYEYYLDTLTNVKESSPIVGIEQNSKAWKMLANNFSLASTYLEYTDDGYIGYMIRLINGAGMVHAGCCLVSAGVAHITGGGVAPVISLNPEIQLKKEGEVWKIK